MKLIRFGPPGEERPGLWLDGTPPRILDVRSVAFDIQTYDGSFFRRHGLERLRGLLRDSPGQLPLRPAEGVRLAPPIEPAQIICVGKNYDQHAKELGFEVPGFPLFFAKSPCTLIGDGDPVTLHPKAGEVDAEAELAVVLGCDAENVSPGEAMKCVAGYTVVNDITDRAIQRRDSQWLLAKNAPDFCPAGPWMITADELPDPTACGVRSRLNAQILQNGRTDEMIYSIPFVISTLSQGMPLRAGDLIATGTPGGVGSALTPPRLLQDGDTIEVEVSGIGTLTNPVRSARG